MCTGGGPGAVHATAVGRVAGCDRGVASAWRQRGVNVTANSTATTAARLDASTARPRRSGRCVHVSFKKASTPHTASVCDSAHSAPGAPSGRSRAGCPNKPDWLPHTARGHGRQQKPINKLKNPLKRSPLPSFRTATVPTVPTHCVPHSDSNPGTHRHTHPQSHRPLEQMLRLRRLRRPSPPRTGRAARQCGGGGRRSATAGG